jgi:hypothetical protein
VQETLAASRRSFALGQEGTGGCRSDPDACPSEALTEHIMAPRNRWVMENPDLTGHAGTPGRGAFLIRFLKIQGDRIAAAKYQT